MDRIGLCKVFDLLGFEGRALFYPLVNSDSYGISWNFTMDERPSRLGAVENPQPASASASGSEVTQAEAAKGCKNNPYKGHIYKYI